MEKYIIAMMRRCYDAIVARNMTGIIPELQKFADSDVDQATINKKFFKLLQYVANAAYNVDRSNVDFGRDVIEITTFICSKMTSVSDGKKFFSSIYHIVASLIKMNFYREAAKITEYLLPEYQLWKADPTISTLEVYESTAQLWRKTSTMFFNSSDRKNIKNYDLFKLMTILQLKLTRLMSKDSTCNVLSALLSHFKNIELKNDCVYKERFKSSMLRFLSTMEITLNDEKSSCTWRTICEILPTLIGKDVDSRNVKTILDHFSCYVEAFRPIVTENKKYLSSFELLECLCVTIIRRVETFAGDETDGWDKLLKKYDDWLSSDDSENSNSLGYAVLQLLSSILNYWEKYSKNEKTKKYIKTDMILPILKLSLKQSNLYKTFELSKCRCESPDCKVTKDTNNDLVLKIKCLSLMSRRSAAMEDENVRDIATNIIRACYKLFETMKRKNCKLCWSLWSPWGAAVYNISVECEKHLPMLSIKFYTHIVESIVLLQGVKTRIPTWGFDNLLGTILHRLSSVCLKNQLYGRARQVASINCLLSHDIEDTSAFRDWANIKYNDSTEFDATILHYLRSHELEIPQVNIDDYDLVKVCLREIQALVQIKSNMTKPIIAVLDTMETLAPKPIDYAQGVQLLCYHSLNFEATLSTKTYLRKATLMYERVSRPDVKFKSIYAMMKFYEFVERTREIRRNTESDMENVVTTLRGIRKNYEFNDRKEYDVVPAYSAINITITSELESALEQAFSQWRTIVACNFDKCLTDWEIRYTIHSIKIAGEYARLYRFEGLENEAWTIIYEIADKISDSLSIVYATSRIMTNAHFQIDWISKADEHAAKLENSSDPYTNEILTRYKLSLINFHYENNENDRADELFDLVARNREIKFLQDHCNFLSLKDIEMKYRFGRNDDDDESKYVLIVVQCLYTLLSLGDSIDRPVYGLKEKHLHDCEMILDFTNSIALRMNSLLSYREISAHLIERLAAAQKLVTSLRVAECLKFLCYIDLSRGKFDDCEVKLQGLEHILEIEAFDATMRSKLSPCRNNKEITTCLAGSNLNVDAIRDIGQSDASPVLRKKVFAKPDFMLHGDGCSCFKCTNVCYQYLVFASTYIRAQLFALRANGAAAFQHFHGAMRIRKCILMKHEADRNSGKEKSFFPSCPRRQREAIEYVMFHLDYCHFLDRSMTNFDDNEILEIALDALELCEKHHLHNHPVFMAVNEYFFQRRFKRCFTKNDCSRFMVPDINEMDVRQYEPQQAENQAICATPARETFEKTLISLKRRKTPPFLNLDPVPIDFDDDEAHEKFKAAIHTAKETSRRLRRRLGDDEDYCNDESEKTDKSEAATIQESKSTLPAKIMEKVDNLPGRSARKKSADRKVGENNVDFSTIVSETTKFMENVQIGTKAESRKNRSRKIVVGSKVFDEVTMLLNGMSIDKREKSNTSGNSASANVATSDIALKPEAEETSNGRRGSARLRKKLQDSVQRTIGENIVAEERDKKETIVNTRRGSRTRLSKEQNANAKKTAMRES